MQGLTCTRFNKAQEECSEKDSQLEPNVLFYWNEFVKVLEEPFDVLQKRDYVVKVFKAWTRVKPGLYFYLQYFGNSTLDTTQSKLYVPHLIHQMDQNGSISQVMVGRTWWYIAFVVLEILTNILSPGI